MIANAKSGSSSTAVLKGGFSVNEDLSVVESYGTRVFGGEVHEEVPPATHSWVCTFLSDTLRICKATDGTVRVYDKVDAAAANAEIARLLALTVDVDPEAAAEDEVEEDPEPLDPMDDPNDTRPAWQKRIDAADGIKRTANGTPINNWGPIGGGPTGPPTTR